jgi:acyl-CoA thioesterase
MEKVAPENRGIDDEFFHTMCARFEEIHAHQTFGISLTYMGPGAVGMKMMVGPEYTTVRERLHGGLIASLLDTAMGQAVVSLRKVGTVTLDMGLNFIAPVFLGDELIAESNVIHIGKSIAVAEASAYDNNGKLVARSRGTFFITNIPDITGAS